MMLIIKLPLFLQIDVLKGNSITGVFVVDLLCMDASQKHHLLPNNLDLYWRLIIKKFGYLYYNPSAFYKNCRERKGCNRSNNIYLLFKE